MYVLKSIKLPSSSGSEGAQAAKAIQSLVSKVYYVQGGADSWQVCALGSRPTHSKFKSHHHPSYFYGASALAWASRVHCLQMLNLQTKCRSQGCHGRRLGSLASTLRTSAPTLTTWLRTSRYCVFFTGPDPSCHKAVHCCLWSPEGLNILAQNQNLCA